MLETVLYNQCSSKVAWPYNGHPLYICDIDSIYNIFNRAEI